MVSMAAIQSREQFERQAFCLVLFPNNISVKTLSTPPIIILHAETMYKVLTPNIILLLLMETINGHIYVSVAGSVLANN